MSCCDEKVKIIQIPLPADDFWRDPANLRPDGTNDVTENINRQGDVGIGQTDATVVAAKLDVNGAQILRTVSVANVPVNGAVGTAGATTDVSSHLILNQTTANIVATLPPPTNAQAGRLLLVENQGAASINVNGQDIATDKGVLFAWNGTEWIPYGSATVPADFFRSGTGTTLPDGTTDHTESITHNGNVGIGLVDPTTLAARLDVSGAVVLRPVSLANFAANAAVGTAAATVDITSTLVLAQTTANITLTIPNPTNTQAGRLLTVANNGTTTTTVAGVPIPAGSAASYIWDGNSWNLVGSAATASGDFWRSGVTASTLPDDTTDVTDDIIHNGKVGIGDTVAFTNATTLAAALDVSGAQVLRPVTLANFAANANVGTAAATTDIASELLIPQTTQNITLTVPNPTNTQAGRIMIVKNTGTAAFLVNTGAGIQKVFPAGSTHLTWTGTVWMPDKHAPYIVPINVPGNITLEAVRHHFEILDYAGAANITITVPNTLPIGFQCSITQSGTGRITFAGSGGMTVQNRWSGFISAGTWAKVGVEVRTATVAVISGDVV